MISGRLPACVVSIAVTLLPAPVLADDFSLERLRAGQEALRARRIPEAVDQLRIACFGLLDQVEPLSECLVSLTLARDAAKRPADVEATLSRFLEVERRFAPYAKAALSPEMRRQFEAVLLAHVPAETVSSIPSLARVSASQTRPPPR